MEPQRLFIAINLSAELRSLLTATQQRLQRKLATYPLRWARPQGIHLTLKFLGDTDPSQIEVIGRMLETAAAPHAPFELPVGSLGAFPNMRRPSVLWVGVHDKEKRLLHLAADVDKAMARLGWQREKRAFSGHLTLARVQKYADSRERRALGAQVMALHGYEKLGTLPVTVVSLMRSQLRPKGSIYTELATIRLGKNA